MSRACRSVNPISLSHKVKACPLEVGDGEQDTASRPVVGPVPAGNCVFI